MKEKKRKGPAPGFGTKGKKYNFRIDAVLEEFFESHGNKSEYINYLISCDRLGYIKRPVGRPCKTNTTDTTNDENQP